MWVYVFIYMYPLNALIHTDTFTHFYIYSVFLAMLKKKNAEFRLKNLVAFIGKC